MPCALELNSTLNDDVSGFSSWSEDLISACLASDNTRDNDTTFNETLVNSVDEDLSCRDKSPVSTCCGTHCAQDVSDTSSKTSTEEPNKFALSDVATRCIPDSLLNTNSLISGQHGTDCTQSTDMIADQTLSDEDEFVMCSNEPVDPLPSVCCVTDGAHGVSSDLSGIPEGDQYKFPPGDDKPVELPILLYSGNITIRRKK